MGMIRSNKDQKNAINAENYYYGQSQDYMNPYTTYAPQDFNAGRSMLYKGINARLGQPRYGQEEFKILGETPQQLDSSIMSGYSMSPLGQEEMKYSMSAADNALNADGMYGSPDSALVDSQIANTITNQDMGRYMGMVGKTAGIQHKAMSDWDKQNQELIGLFRDMLGTENHASQFMAQDAEHTGQDEGNTYSRAAQNSHFFSPLDQIASLAGLGFGMMSRPSGSSGGLENDPLMREFTSIYGYGDI